MTNCNYCHSGSEEYYLYTNCQHLICTVCAFQRADFSLQTIDCCGMQTTIAEDAISIIIKSRRFKHSPPHLDFPRQTQTHTPIVSNSINHGVEHDHIFEDNIVFQQNKKSLRQSSYQVQDVLDTDKQKAELEKILLTQIQRIKLEFDAEHQKLRQKQTNLVNQLLSTYEDQLKNIFGSNKNLNSHNKIDTIKQRMEINHPNIRSQQKNFQNQSKIQSRIQNLCLKISRYSLGNEQYHPQNERKATTMRQQNVKPDQNLRESDWQKISEPKKNKVEYDYILKKLEINQERMNSKLQRHAQIAA